MLSLRERPLVDISIESTTKRLTETILGNDDHDLADTLKAIASDIGHDHIPYLRLSPDKSPDICLLVAVVTYSRLWTHRYFVKKYITDDPVISYGRAADQPFDWANVPVNDPAAKAFFVASAAQALPHGAVLYVVPGDADLETASADVSFFLAALEGGSAAGVVAFGPRSASRLDSYSSLVSTPD